MRKIPGLNDLRVFEAAARLQNFRQAAEELHLTHGAVSHRVRALEDQLAVSLFDRQNGVQLTEAGRELHVAVDEALRLLGDAVDRLVLHHSSARPLLRLSVLPTFAARWLLPRLPDFYRLHPDVALQVEASVDLADLGPQGVDAALRLGSGEWKGVRSMRLLDEYYYPVASPEFVREYGPQDPKDLLHLPLIRHSGSLGGGASWSEFFAALQLSGKTPLRSVTFDDGNLALRAAEQGMGIAFARHNLVAQDIREGRLVRLFDCGLRGAYATYFVSELKPANSPGVEALYQWLLEQARQCGAASESEFAGIRWLA